MKKTTLISLCFFLIFTSCKKSYQCECSINGTTTVLSSGSVKFKKSEAESWCKSYAQGGGECHLK